MIFRVTMKTPDALGMAVSEAVGHEIRDMLPGEARKDRMQDLADEAYAVAKPFFRYGEYLTVEIDTVAKTCAVVPNGH